MDANNHIIQLKPWEDKDLDLLLRINSPEMTQHLGGSESKEQILKRHKRYLELGNKGRMFSIILLSKMEPIGSVGYWQTTWNNESVYETGWSVLPSFQGKGIATKAVKLAVEEASLEKKYKYIHAFPSIDNPASNAICRKLNFQFISECEFEYPLGSFMRCNNWRYNIIGQ
ncbi:GNAT family N-acetyltransferase [Lederbergia wuyishanensis]|uniref:RimJ/RimL family protein N-acetyltransferase n=1 Tax=Lederbergia wuyishanensis TaxID=1347903 RepID=A0ABU0D4B1_9BACI|nr:GNAT family N-acetyltransferase [Lederbergia wuyishanensis]MCJ8008171.1 GNAT family N-acetyltransferase [Lederbergia wuyishanensis]MDQ0343240.1 RimJ/RimL family protein N-acetyltransferase [Lederbergia wuyishanensis]